MQSKIQKLFQIFYFLFYKYFIQLSFQSLQCLRPNPFLNHLTVFKNLKSRDRHDLVFLRQIRIFINIAFGNFNWFISQFLELIALKLGPIILQGPHHSAQKSTKTGTWLSSTSWVKLAEFNVISDINIDKIIKICYNLSIVL